MLGRRARHNEDSEKTNRNAIKCIWNAFFLICIPACFPQLQGDSAWIYLIHVRLNSEEDARISVVRLTPGGPVGVGHLG